MEYDEEKAELDAQFACRGDYSPHNPDLAVENVKTPLNAFDNTPEFRTSPEPCRDPVCQARYLELIQARLELSIYRAHPIKR